MARYIRHVYDVSDCIVDNIGYMDTFLFSPSGYRNVYLPCEGTIAEKVGTVYYDNGESWSNVNFNSAIFINVIVVAHASNDISIKVESHSGDQTIIVDNNGNNVDSLEMGKGDCATFMYNNKRWYLFNFRQ